MRRVLLAIRCTRCDFTYPRRAEEGDDFALDGFSGGFMLSRLIAIGNDGSRMALGVPGSEYDAQRLTGLGLRELDQAGRLHTELACICEDCGAFGFYERDRVAVPRRWPLGRRSADGPSAPACRVCGAGRLRTVASASRRNPITCPSCRTGRLKTKLVARV